MARAAEPGGWTLAGGRALPPLLFATSADGLARNLGRGEARAILDALRAAGQTVFDGLPRLNLPRPKKAAPAIETVRGQLAAHPGVEGVVLLGGYDVVPSQVLDCLPPRLRKTAGLTGDPDDFIVWSDDAYGDRDGDGLPELPVSRIPDGRSPELVRSALGAVAGAPVPLRRGIRNVARPFAVPIFRRLPGTATLPRSEPLTAADPPAAKLAAERLYLMLHGKADDGTRFWGEAEGEYLEAVNLETIAEWHGGVVLSGCCWGALPVDLPARFAGLPEPLGPRSPEASLALSLLARGAAAFVGCTGAHYSPTKAPYDYYGGPMHEAFWAAHLAGVPPAAALLQAKREFIRGMPHGRTADVAQAVEFKTLRQFTCLGLGW